MAKFKIKAISYGYATVEAETKEEALDIARHEMDDSDFEWDNNFSDVQIAKSEGLFYIKQEDLPKFWHKNTVYIECGDGPDDDVLAAENNYTLKDCLAMQDVRFFIDVERLLYQCSYSEMTKEQLSVVAKYETKVWKKRIDHELSFGETVTTRMTANWFHHGWISDQTRDNLDTYIHEKVGVVRLSSLSRGDTFLIGGREFIVLNCIYDDDFSGHTTFVASKDPIGRSLPFDEDLPPLRQKTNDYKESMLRESIEKMLQPAIEHFVGSKSILSRPVNRTNLCGEKEFDSFNAKVRLLTFDEVRKYRDLLNKDANYSYWTCSSWSSDGVDRDVIVAVDLTGNFKKRFIGDDCYVRPCFILDSDIWVEKATENVDDTPLQDGGFWGGLWDDEE